MKLGLIGEKLGHSLSPEIHQKIFEKLGICGTYNLLPIARMNLKDTVETLLESMDGFNVTIPYKTDIMPFLDEISPEARTIGAVNTVAVHDGKRYGYNTDYDGFARTLDKIAADVKGAPSSSASTTEAQALFSSSAAALKPLMNPSRNLRKRETASSSTTASSTRKTATSSSMPLP